MPAKLIDGKRLALETRAEIAKEVAELKRRSGVIPGLAAVLVGEDPASQVYVRNKEAACKKAGMKAWQHRLPASSSESDLLGLIKKLNDDSKVHGILVQLPLPKGINTDKILKAVSVDKDVDGFHPVSMGNLLAGNPSFVPCTPLGIIKILESIDCRIEGKEAVVIGRSNIVGKPIALLLMQRHATVTICHTRTQDISKKVATADIVVAAAGRPNTIKGSWIKPGAVVIDVGINRGKDGKLTGDVEFAAAKERAGWITPVPGGVGPMTIAMLLQSTLESAKQNKK